MRHRFPTGLVLVVVLTLAGCALPAPGSPSPTDAPPASPTPRASPTPVPTPTLTAAEEAEARDAMPPGSRSILATTADCDDDGRPDTLVFYAAADQDQADGHGLIIGGDGVVRPLGPDEGPALFVADTAPEPVSVQVYDHNDDGRPEVVVTGAMGGGASTVTIFAWDGDRCDTLLRLTGQDGTTVEAYGRVVAVREQPGAGYAVERTATWDGDAYRVRPHYRVSVGIDTCRGRQSGPSCTLVAFYQLVERGDTKTAKTLLVPSLRDDVEPDGLAQRFGQALLEVGEADVEAGSAAVPVRVSTGEGEQRATWSLAAGDEGWVLEAFQAVADTSDGSPEHELRELLGDEAYAKAVPVDEHVLHWGQVDLDGNGQDEVAVRTCVGACDPLAPDAEAYLRMLELAQGGYVVRAELEVPFGLTGEPSFEVVQARSDGGKAIIELSPCGAHATCLNLYTWTGDDYRAFSFSSSALGITVNPDGTVVLGQRDYLTESGDNGWTETYRWDGRGYVLSEVSFEGPAYDGPAGAVRAYFNALSICLDEGLFDAAYAYLSREFQDQHPYGDYAAGFADTMRLVVEKVELVEERTDGATVAASILATEEVDGGEELRGYDVIWQLIREEGAWRLDQAEVQER